MAHGPIWKEASGRLGLADHHDVRVPVVEADTIEGILNLGIRSFEYLNKDVFPADQRAGYAVHRIVSSRRRQNACQREIIETKGARIVHQLHEWRFVGLHGLEVPDVSGR